MSTKPSSNYKTGENESRPWGKWQVINNDDFYCVKKIEVKKGAKLSLQYHIHRAEHWVIVKGRAEITLGGDKIIANCGEHIYIPNLTQHRIHNIGENSLIFIEIQYGTKLDEKDIIRLDDDYMRA